MTNEVTLLPCPFCGRSDATRYGRSSEFHEDCDGDSGNDDYFAVFCDASEPRGLGGCGASSGFAKTCEEAALRWNRRPTDEPPVDLTDLEKRMKALCTCPKPGTSSSTDDPMCPLAFPHPWNRSAPNRGGD